MGLTDWVTVITTVGGLALGVLNTYWKLRGDKPKYAARVDHLEARQYRLVNCGRASITVTVMMGDPAGLVDDVPEMFKLRPDLFQDFTLDPSPIRQTTAIRVFFEEGAGRRFRKDACLLAPLP